MSKKAGVVAAISLLALAGCQSASTTETWETKRSYATYDLQVQDHVAAEDISQAIKKALQNSAEQVRIFHDLPPSRLPETPARFTLFGPFGESADFSFINDSDFKTPSCNGALVYAKATSISDKGGYIDGQLYACLWQYQKGYHIDIYSQHEIRTDSLMPDQERQDISNKTPCFITKAFTQIQVNLAQLSDSIVLVDEYPANFTARLPR